MLNTPAAVAVVVQKVVCTKVPADDVAVAMVCQPVLTAQIAQPLVSPRAVTVTKLEVTAVRCVAARRVDRDDRALADTTPGLVVSPEPLAR